MNDSDLSHLSRRKLLSALGIGAFGSAPAAAAQSVATGRTLTIEQGDTCRTVEPLGDGTRPVEEFYNHDNAATDFSSIGPTDLQRPDTSILFFYDGVEGLSLVFIHGKYQGTGDGGSISVSLSGLPDGSDWAVYDDKYNRATNYDIWTGIGSQRTVDWTWDSSRTDGGALRGFDGEFETTVEMAFNEEATLFGDYYDGTVTDWQFLSGDRDNPERIPLDKNVPLQLSTGGCGTTQSPEQEAPFDVQPETDQGPVEPGSDGRITIVIRSTANFDARTVETRSLRFGPTGARPVATGIRDVDGDGRPDLVVQFTVQSLGLDSNTERLTLTGTTDDGTKIEGTAEITVAPQGGSGEDEEPQTHPDEDSDDHEPTEEPDENEDEADDHEPDDDEDEDDDDDDNDDDDNDDEGETEADDSAEDGEDDADGHETDSDTEGEHSERDGNGHESDEDGPPENTPGEGDTPDDTPGEGGPPDHAGPPNDDDGGGPPEHAGPPDDEDEDDDDEEEEDEDEEEEEKEEEDDD